MARAGLVWRRFVEEAQRLGTIPAILAYLAALVLLVAALRVGKPGLDPLAGSLHQVLILVGMLVAGFMAWLVPAAHTSVPAAHPVPQQVDEPPLSDAARASIAVLPLEALSSGADDEQLAKAFSAEIIRALSGVPDLRVVPHMQSAIYEGRTLRDVARELDVRYVMSGSLQRATDRLRVIVMLTDAGNGRQAWSQSYDKDIHDVFQVQREVAEAIAIETGSRSLNIISEDLCRQAPRGLSAWSLTHKAITFWTVNFSRDASTEAIGWLEQAIRLEPGNAMAHVLLGFVLNQRVVNHFSKDAPAENMRALAEVDAALRLAPRDATVMEYASIVWINCGFRSRCLQTARRVVAISPFNMTAWGYVGCALCWGGSPAEIAEGLAVLQRLLKVAPHHPSLPFWHFFLACAYGDLQDYQQAHEHAQAAVEFHAGFCLGWVTIANALGELGDREASRQAMARARDANPLFNLENHQRYYHFIARECPETPFKQTSGLVKAGLLQAWPRVPVG